MENFENSLDLTIFDELPETEAFEYIKAKYWEKIKEEVVKIINKRNGVLNKKT